MPLPFSAQNRAPARPRPAAERLFIALWPDAQVRARLAQAARGFAADGRLIDAANLHMTLVFLGQVAATSRLPIMRAMRAAAPSPFEIALDHFGYFAGSRVLWIGDSAPPPELPALRERLAGGMRRAGFAGERRAFMAHVTLARDCAKPAALADAEPVVWRAHQLALVRSHLARGGARYEVVEALDF